jgi:hypothetical protein
MKLFSTDVLSVRSLLGTVVCLLLACGNLAAQLPYINAGPDSAFAQMDFAQMYMDASTRQQKKNQEQNGSAQ